MEFATGYFFSVHSLYTTLAYSDVLFFKDTSSRRIEIIDRRCQDGGFLQRYNTTHGCTSPRPHANYSLPLNRSNLAGSDLASLSRAATLQFCPSASIYRRTVLTDGEAPLNTMSFLCFHNDQVVPMTNESKPRQILPEKLLLLASHQSISVSVCVGIWLLIRKAWKQRCQTSLA